MNVCYFKLTDILYVSKKIIIPNNRFISVTNENKY